MSIGFYSQIQHLIQAFNKSNLNGSFSSFNSDDDDLSEKRRHKLSLTQKDRIDDLIFELELGKPETIIKFNQIVQWITEELLFHIYQEEEEVQRPKLDF